MQVDIVSEQTIKQNKKTGWISGLLKGVVIGASMLFPGLSGGTMAIILGIYQKLIRATADFFKNKKQSFGFLLPVAVGGLIGACLFAKPLLGLITRFRMPMMYLFLGAITGSMPMLIKKSGVKKLRISHLLCFCIGLMLVLGLSRLPAGWISGASGGGVTFFLLLFAGVILAVALVLPGISASYMLLVLGIYDITLNAIGNRDVLFLSPLAIGAFFGVLLTTRLLETAMDRYPTVSYLVIAGFVMGSVTEVYPGIPAGGLLPICAAMLLIGFCGVFFLGRSACTDT